MLLRIWWFGYTKTRHELSRLRRKRRRHNRTACFNSRSSTNR